MRRNTMHPLQPTTHWWHTIKLSTQKFALVLTITAFATGFVYVLLTNQTATQGFSIRSLEKQLTDLKADNEKLQLKTADLRSLTAADRLSQALDLQPVDKFEVMTVGTGPVARTP